MAQNIILKRSSLSGKVPTTSSLDLGEIALNTYDGRAFIHKSGSEESIEQIVVTNSITTGSINITYTGSFGEIEVTNDLNVGDSIYVTNDIVGGGDVDVVGAVTASFFVGDGSQLTGIDTSTDTEIPANEWDYNLPDSGSLSDGNNTSIKYTIDFQAEGYDVRPVGYQTFITNNNGSTEIIPGTEGILFIVNNQEVGRIGVEGIVATPSPGTVSGSSQVIGILDSLNTFSASQYISNSYFATTGSNQFNGSQSISGSVTLSGSLNNLNYIDFNTASAQPTWKSGRVFWDNTDGCVTVYNAEADVTLQVGQENWTRVYNGSGVTITNGTPVRLSGTHGNVPEITLAQSIAISGSSNIVNQILGLATHTIEAGTFGYITTQGLVRGLNTNAYTDGATLYVGTTAGTLSTTAPATPYEKIPIGQCVKAGPGASGIIYVAVEQPMDFSDLSSVNVGTFTNGDMWQYSGSGATGGWYHKTISQIGLATTGSNTYTGLQTFQQIQEVISLKPSIGLGTHNFDFNSGSIFYVGGLTGSGTWNVQNIPSSSNTATSLTFVVEQGATAYTASAYQLGGTALTVKWLDGTVPTGSANSTDVIGLTAFRSGSSWNAIGSLSKFS